MTKISLSVIIVSYKQADIVLDCISSIYQYNDIGEQLEIILVDNSPTHNVYHAVVEEFATVHAIKNNNTGFGAGNNLGAAKATGEYILFLNPDTILVESIFKFAINKFEINSNLSMFGLKLVSKKLKRNASFYLMDGGGIFRNILIKLCNICDVYIDGFMYISGANLFIKRNDFIQCGQFDKNIFMYYEEPDLTMRLHELGKSTNYYNDKKIIHLEGGTSSDSELALRRRLDSALYFYRKIHKNPTKLFVRELRLDKLKYAIYKITGSNKITQTSININILSEYIATNK